MVVHYLLLDMFSYSHNAIVLSVNGNPVRVIHFTRDSSSSSFSSSSSGLKAVINKDTIKYESSMDLYRVVYRRDASSPVDLTIAHADAMINAQKNYHLTKGNCEHLATWCKTGVWQSSQLDFLPSHLKAVKDSTDSD